MKKNRMLVLRHVKDVRIMYHMYPSMTSQSFELLFVMVYYLVFSDILNNTISNIITILFAMKINSHNTVNIQISPYI